MVRIWNLSLIHIYGEIDYICSRSLNQFNQNVMINRELINPQSIVVVGGSNNVHKPGGRLVRNLLDGKYKGELYVVNAKEDDVQGLKSYHSVHDLSLIHI